MSADAGAAPELAPEDRARASCYALIGCLMYGPPDEALRARILGAPSAEGATPLAVAWRELHSALREVPPDEVRAEYDDLFVSVGKAPVSLYTATYIAPHAPDRHLLALRERLDAWQLARRTDAGEPEDHLSGVCDVMRWLIESGRGMEAERRFFFEFVAPAVEPLCAAIADAPQARFYRAVAACLAAFCEVERTAFELAASA